MGFTSAATIVTALYNLAMGIINRRLLAEATYWAITPGALPHAYAPRPQAGQPSFGAPAYGKGNFAEVEMSFAPPFSPTLPTSMSASTPSSTVMSAASPPHWTHPRNAPTSVPYPGHPWRSDLSTAAEELATPGNMPLSSALITPVITPVITSALTPALTPVLTSPQLAPPTSPAEEPRPSLRAFVLKSLSAEERAVLRGKGAITVTGALVQRVALTDEEVVLFDPDRLTTCVELGLVAE
jgi:hypothetical protein